MKQALYAILFFVLYLFPKFGFASHIVGGEMTYRCLGAGSGNTTLYEISLTIYHDCLNGQPQAIVDDNPAFLGIYDGNNLLQFVDTGVYYTSRMTVPANFSNNCITNYPLTCLQKMTFKKTYSLPNNLSGYYIVYQRCCRNEHISNIGNPGETGATYFCKIPPAPSCNNSAIFKNFPPQIICLNNPLIYDHSATDVDGDSLSYEFCETNIGGTINDVKPYVPTSPPFPTVAYVAGFTMQRPMAGNPLIKIDPSTGLISGTPNLKGRFVVTVCCHEWKNGVLVNTVKREFQFEVTDCSKAVIADMPQYSDEVNTYIVNCTGYDVKFDNTSTGGFSYFWDFGVTTKTDDTSNVFSPSYTYSDTGTYVVKLIVNRGTTCPDSIERFVKIYPYFKSNFNYTGKLCPNTPIAFIDSSSSSLGTATHWEWSFGDGLNATDQHPSHQYLIGGNYAVTFISGNSKGCSDTIKKYIAIEKFVPFAGNDTIIIKESSIQFNAQGGGSYTWSPATNLDNPNIGNPIGTYPTIGTFPYQVHIVSAASQCEGDDSIVVRVVDKASLFVPSAFTPNGDGRNDILRPIGVGYSQVNYFRVYSRWGEMMYASTKFNQGWDGYWKGVPAELGVYYWVLSVKDRFGKEELIKGDVTLIR